MKSRLLGTIAIASLALGLGLSADAQGQAALVIQGGTLIDGNGGAPVPNSVIVIQGNRIAAVGRAGQVQVPAGAQVVNASGKWITPGLIDGMAGGYWGYGEALLHWGVTSVMLNVARGEQGIAERDAINHGIYPGPRMYMPVLNAQMRTPEEARARARAMIAAGADYVGSGDGMQAPEVYAAFADEAHKAGKAALMRCLGPLTRAKTCVLAGADVMLHTGAIGNDLSKNSEKWKDYIGLPPYPYCDMDPAKEKDMIAFLVAHNTAVEPNFVATSRGFPSNWKRVQQESREIFEDPAFAAYYPELAIHDLWDNVQSPELYLSPDEIAFKSCGFKNHAKFIGDLIAAGGRALVSSDDTQSAPGLGVQQEMAIFQEDAHVPPMKIIQAATKWVAEGFKIADIGTVEPGKFADLVIVNADPTQDILNMRKIDNVIKDGRVIDRSYHAWYRGGMFANDRVSYDDEPVSNIAWVNGLKGLVARGQGVARPVMTVVGPNGKEIGILPGVADVRKGPGLGPVPNYTLSPTPGIEAIAPQTVIQGAPETTVTLTGINFVKRSVAYVNDTPVPTMVDSATKLRLVVPADMLAPAGKLHITVKNPKPMAVPEWGDTSNTAHILVPFSFTKLARN
jgi:hypothetical protein